MTLSEFKAWLSGFEASFQDGTPNAEQYRAIAEKLASVHPDIDFRPIQPINPYPGTTPWKLDDRYKIWYSNGTGDNPDKFKVVTT